MKQSKWENTPDCPFPVNPCRAKILTPVLPSFVGNEETRRTFIKIPEEDKALLFICRKIIAQNLNSTLAWIQMLNVLILNLSQLKPFVSIWSIKPGFPLIQSLSESFQVYPSNTSPINFSLHLLAIAMIQGLRTFPRSLHLYFFFPISIYGYIFPDESFYILVLVKSLPKLGCASQSTIEEVLSSTPKPEIPGPSHCSRFALVNIARYGSPLHVCMLDHFSHVRVCLTQQTVACQTLLSTGFSGQEYCSGLPFCHPEDLVDIGIELTSLMSPAQAGRFFTTSTT